MRKEESDRKEKKQGHKVGYRTIAGDGKGAERGIRHRFRIPALSLTKCVPLGTSLTFLGLFSSRKGV